MFLPPFEFLPRDLIHGVGLLLEALGHHFYLFWGFPKSHTRPGAFCVGARRFVSGPEERRAPTDRAPGPTQRAPGGPDRQSAGPRHKERRAPTLFVSGPGALSLSRCVWSFCIGARGSSALSVCRGPTLSGSLSVSGPIQSGAFPFSRREPQTLLLGG